MTRKDYIRLADALNRAYELREHDGDFPNLQEQQYVILEVTDNICDQLEYDNRYFDRKHFIAVVKGEKPLNSRP